MDIKVCYSGFLDASSGMGEAARNIVAALYTSGVDLTTEVIPNIAARIDLGNSYNITKSLQGRPLDYDFKIIHITPDLVTNYFTPMKYHIFHLFWETDRLPKWWVWCLNLCDEIWTGDARQKELFKKSGVWRNIWVAPQPIDTSITQANKYTFKGHEGFTFYSIFQWIERKNPRGLIEAYWREFEGDKDVALIIKTFKDKFTADEIIKIRQDIESWRKQIKLNHYPKIGLLVEAWDKKDIFRLHATGDCLVSAHRGEGWGVPVVEAMLMGKPVISTGLGGIHEHVPDDTMYKIKYEWKNVHDMNWAPWYDETQLWGEPDITDLRSKMRYVYGHQDEAKVIGERAKKYVVDNLNFLKIGNEMKSRLADIKRDIIDK